MKITSHPSDCGPAWRFTWRDAFLALLVFVIIAIVARYAPHFFQAFAE